MQPFLIANLFRSSKKLKFSLDAQFKHLILGLWIKKCKNIFIGVFFQNKIFAHAAIHNFRYNTHIQIKFCRVMHSSKMHSLNYNFFQIPFGSWDTGPKLWHFGVNFGPNKKKMCSWKIISSWKLLAHWITINNRKILWKFETNTIIRF